MGRRALAPATSPFDGSLSGAPLNPWLHPAAASTASTAEKVASASGRTERTMSRVYRAPPRGRYMRGSMQSARAWGRGAGNLPLVIAHRGASALETENTVEA